MVYKELGLYEDAISRYQQSIEIAQAIENKATEGITLGNLGDALLLMRRTEEGKQTLLSSIELCNDFFPLGASVFKASLAVQLAHEGCLDEAVALLDGGEKAMKNVPKELGKFLCKKALVHLLCNDIYTATSALQDARRISSKLKVKENSVLARAISHAEGFVKEYGKS